MHMVNDKGEAVYYNLVRKNNKDHWLVQGIGSTVVYDGTGSAARAAISPRNSRRSATLPGMVSGPIDRRFFRRKNPPPHNNL